MSNNKTIRTRFAPSPTGYMHIGNLRSALYEYLVAKANGGKFILRIEDTDQNRLVEGSVDVIYNTLKTAGIQHDEGPDVGGEYGPYVQSERKSGYLKYAQQLVQDGKAYYCFCSKERLDTLVKEDAADAVRYDRHCMTLSKEEVDKNLTNAIPYVIRQIIPEGKTTFKDEVFGEITFDNKELDDQILIKSDGMPTYNFANVIDDHLMEITHVIRGNEYLSSTPKYNLLYDAFGWDIPTYIHLPLVLNSNGEKLSKRKGDASFEDLLEMGYLPEAIINYIALLGWSPDNNEEFFTLGELEKVFTVSGLSKSPSTFDMQKLTWFNGEYFKRMSPERFHELALPYVEKSVARRDINICFDNLVKMAQSRITFLKDIYELFDFIDTLPDYSNDLYTHKKMKTDAANSLESLKLAKELLEGISEADWSNDNIYSQLSALAEKSGFKSSIILWPVRTALSGKPSSPCGASELAELLGKTETIARVNKGIEKLS